MTGSKVNPDDRRQYLRMKIDSSAQLQTADLKTINVSCKDLSAGGAQVQLNSPLDETVSYQFLLVPKHPNGQPLRAMANVIWSSSIKHDQSITYTYGLSFSDID